MRRLLYPTVLAFSVAMLTSASAMPIGGSSLSGAPSVDPGDLIQKAWHSGLPHRRIIGERVYGGTCPPEGCPAWTQRDLRRDRYTGQWYSPENEARQERMRRRYDRY
jgi:hypothetical protein